MQSHPRDKFIVGDASLDGQPPNEQGNDAHQPKVAPKSLDPAATAAHVAYFLVLDGLPFSTLRCLRNGYCKREKQHWCDLNTSVLTTNSTNFLSS